MNASTTKLRSTKTKANGAKPVLTKIPIGAGITHGMVYIIPFIPRTSIKNLNIQMLTIGVTTKGMKKIGFIIIGAPNKIGSLTEKLTGINEALPKAFNCFDLAKNRNKNTRIKVDPVPPIFIT